MVVWPIQYPQPQLLLVFIAFAAICFACYRLTLTIVLMLLVFIVKRGLNAMGLLNTSPQHH
jgi:hypothetical protein